MTDSISTPGMGAMGVVRALTGNHPGKMNSGKKKKKITRRKGDRRKKR